jgi:hypothetical protein
MARLFISYSRADEAFARQLARSLSDLGADIWIDVEAIPAGVKWSRAIQQGLDICDALCVIISPDSMTSNNVEDEWQYYLEQQKPVVPIFHRPAKVHFQLSRIQYVNFYSQNYDLALRQLHSELGRRGIRLQPISGRASSIPLPSQHPLPVKGRSGRGGWIIGLLALIAVLVVGIVFISRGMGSSGASTETPLITSTAPVVTQETPTATDIPVILQPHPIICAGAPPSRLNVGMRGQVRVAPEGAQRRQQNVRTAPSMEGESIARLPEGAAFTIVGGPECADGFIWWQIDTVRDGWTAEGQLTSGGAYDYFLEPAS